MVYEHYWSASEVILSLLILIINIRIYIHLYLNLTEKIKIHGIKDSLLHLDVHHLENMKKFITSFDAQPLLTFKVLQSSLLYSCSWFLETSIEIELRLLHNTCFLPQ